MIAKKAGIRESFCFFVEKSDMQIEHIIWQYMKNCIMINRTVKKIRLLQVGVFSQHFGMFNSMLENMIAVQKELVLERTYYMDDKMAYFMNMLIDEDDIKC